MLAPQMMPLVADSARAEAMLTIMAARRARAAGLPLGDLQPRLQASFGESQPQAVARLVAADREGVSSQSLLRDFDLIAASLLHAPQTPWQKLQQEAQTLFVLRKGDKVPSGPESNLARARDYLSAGNVEATMRIVQSLPGAANARSWLEKARRYQEAQLALDRLEQAALSMPRPGPAVAPEPPAAEKVD